MKKCCACDPCSAEWIIIWYTGNHKFSPSIERLGFQSKQALDLWLSMGIKEFSVWTISYEQERMTQKVESKVFQVHPRIIGDISKNWDWVILKGWEQRWYWHIWHFLHVHEYVHVHVLVHMYGGQRTTSSVVPHSGHLPYFIETKVLTRIWGSPFRLGWLVLHPRHLPVSAYSWVSLLDERGNWIMILM